MKKISLILMVISLVFSLNSMAQKKKKQSSEKDNYIIKSSDLAAFKFRSIGPAMISGRIIDLAVNPENHSEYFVAAASGGVWKTTDGGITFKAVFDGQRPYSIGCVTYAPSNTHVIWVGSGENNSQRSVSRGDGVYK